MLNETPPKSLFKVYVTFGNDDKEYKYALFLDKKEDINGHVNDWLKSTEVFSPVALRDYLRTNIEGLKVYTKRDLKDRGLKMKISN
jgi:hypothetical protein